MATTKQKVQGYLESDIAQEFNRFKQNEGLSDSQALNRILEDYFGLTEATPGAIDSGELDKRIQEVVERELNEFAVRMGDRLNQMAEDLKKQIDELKSESLHSLPTTTNNQEEPLPILEVIGNNSASITDDSVSDSPAIQGLPVCPKGCEVEHYATTMTRHTSSTGIEEYWCAECKSIFDASLNEVHRDESTSESLLIHLLTRAELAKRLGVRPETIWKNREKANFSEWTKQKDPDNLAWVYRGENSYEMIQS